MDFYHRLEEALSADLSKQIELVAALEYHWHPLAVKLLEKYH